MPAIKENNPVYTGRVVEFLYNLKTQDPRPLHEGDLATKFSADEHRLFASGSDVVWISENPNKDLQGYWEKRREVAKIHVYDQTSAPVRMVTYAQVDFEGIPGITRPSLSEMTKTVHGKSKKWSPQTLEVMRRY